MALADIPMRKPRLLVILGAGTSMPCGMPSVGEIDKLIRRWSREWTPEPCLDFEHDVYSVLSEASERYYGSNHYGIRPNFERILGEMTSLATWLSPPPFGNPIIEAIDGGAPVSALHWLNVPSDPNAGRKLILSQQAFLLERLAGHMRGLSRNIDARSPTISHYAEFLCTLRDRFDLGIYNLNYDTVAHNAWPEAFCGFTPGGRFDASGVNQRREWGFIYHLHGSVHHCIADHAHRVEWKQDLGSHFRDRLDAGPDMAQDFRPVPLTTLVAGGSKLDQLLADPFQTFYSSLVRHTQEADTLLIAGYGFGDLHVNRALRKRFHMPDNDTPFPKAIILEKSPCDKLRTASLQSHDFWAYQLTHTLDTKFRMTGGHINRELTVAPLIGNGDFETDIRNRVAIWHGGFCEAFSLAERICDWLSKPA